MPVLGICYGMQTMAAQLGGQVESSTHREFGAAQVRPTADSRLLDGLEDNRDAAGRRVLDVWMSHGDRVVAVPPGFKVIACERQRAARRHGRRDRGGSTPCSSIPR